MREFYNFVRDADGNDILYIDGEISSDESWWGHVVYPRAFRQQLAKCQDVTVWINSPGGDVFAGAEIYTALKEHAGRVTVKIAGIAASAASVIAMAGDEVLMSPVGYMMIHDPWSYAVGNYRDMDHMSQILKEIGEGLIAAYTAKTGKSRDEIVELLSAETYMSAQRAIEEGFADGLMDVGTAEPTSAKANQHGTMMRASAYSPKAICAKLQGESGERWKALRLADNDPQADEAEKATRAAIMERARAIAALYPEN